MTDIQFGIETLSPADAEALLGRNSHNRPISDSDVMKWAAEMENGRWTLNGEAIKIARDGTILDGQHRLQALALQGPAVRIQFMVVRDLDPATQKTMDQGRKRSAADQLHLAGVQSDRSLAAAIRLWLVWHQGLLFRDKSTSEAQITTPVIVEWAVAHRDEVEILRAGFAYRRIKAKPGLISFIYALIVERFGTDLADEFFSRTLDGVGLPLGSPILALRNKLDQIRGDGGRDSDRAQLKLSDRDMIGFFIVAFNRWVMGHQQGRLQRPNGGTWTADNYPRLVSTKQVKALGTRVERGSLPERDVQTLPNR